jgi:hypothetical protein
MSDGSITASVMMMMMPGEGSVQADDTDDSMIDLEKEQNVFSRQHQHHQQQQQHCHPTSNPSSYLTSSPTYPPTTTLQRPLSVLKPHRYTSAVATTTMTTSTASMPQPSAVTAATISEESLPTAATKKRVTLMVSPEETSNHHDQSTTSTSKRSAEDDMSGNNNNNNNNNNAKHKKTCWCNSTVIYSLFGIAITMTVVAVGINMLLYFDRQNDSAATTAATTTTTTTTTTIDSPPSSTHDFSRPPSTTPSKDDNPWLGIFPPSTSPSINAPSQLSDQDIHTLITDIVTNQFRVDLSKEDPMAPTNRAVQWLIEEAKEYHNHNSTQVYHTLEKFSQRFAVLVLLYALTTTTSSSSSSSSSSSLLSSSTDTTNVNATLDTIPHWGLDECDWVGVVCDENDENDDENDKMISQIDFSDWNMSGTIPAEIKFLPKLVHLDLSNNQLRGSLPEELFGLKRMKRIYLYQNQLTGTLSSSISLMESLQVLHLSHNRFKGPIPQELQQSNEEGFRPLRKLRRILVGGHGILNFFTVVSSLTVFLFFSTF